MAIELLSISYAFLGGLVISCSFFLIHLFSSINPYHRLSFPLTSSSSGLALSILAVLVLKQEATLLAIREVVAFAVMSVISFLPFIFIVLTSALLKASISYGENYGEARSE